MANPLFLGYDSIINNAADALGLLGLDQGPGGTSLVIEELGVSEPRTITLKGRAMPYREVEWPVEQHSRLTWYPGNPRATQQILGPREEGTTFEGKWKDRFMLDAIQIGPGNALAEIIDPFGIVPTDAPKTAEQAVQLFHGLCRAGTEVRVQWLSEVRIGILKRFVPTYDRAQDVAWEMEFEWHSRDDQVQLRAAEELPSLSDLQNLMNAIDDLMDAIPLFIDTVNAFVARTVSLIDEIRETLTTFVDLLRIAETLVNLPNTLVGAINNAANQLNEDCTELIRRIGGPRSQATEAAPEVLQPKQDPTSRSASTSGSASADGRVPVSSTVTQTAKWDAWRKGLVTGTQRLRGLVFKVQRSIQRRVQPNTTRLVTAREGTTTYAVSRRFYGTPDFAGFLSAANQLPNANVPAGFRLRIPPRPIGAAALPEASSSTTGGTGRTTEPLGCPP